MKVKIIYLLLLAYCSMGCVKATDDNKVMSPDGRNAIILSLNSEGVPTYQVLRDGKTLINSSALGFIEKNDINLANQFKLNDVIFDSKDEAWTQPWGENKNMREHYNEMAVNLKNNRVNLTLRFRAFNDGIGFRYEYNVSDTDSLYLMDELTEFNILKNLSAVLKMPIPR